MKVREALAEYLAAKKREMGPKTLNGAKRTIGYFCDFCEGTGIQLEDVRARTVGEHLDYLSTTHTSKQGGPLSTHTLFHHVALIKAFLNWCSQEEEFEEYVKASMVRKIHSPKKDAYVIETFTAEQVKALLKACEKADTGSPRLNAYLHARNRAIVLLLLDTGIRAAELCGLQLAHINLSPEDPHIKVFGKGDKWREIGLGEKCRKELRRFVNKHRASESDTKARLFCTKQGGPLAVRSLIRIITELGDHAEIQGVRCSPHSFRHTYSTMFMRNGGDIYRLSKLLGHTSVKITENYLKTFNQQDARRGAISPLDEAF